MRLEVVIWRGSIAESRHRLSAVVARPDGALALATADAGATSFRSAAKPFQLLPLVERGHADRYGFSPAELAIMSASHTGTKEHVALVRGLLEKLGLDESRLACGFHPPFDAEAAAALAADDRSPIYNNCSGKHAGFLALALAEGWPVEGYHEADHPLQVLMRRTVAEACGLPAAALTLGIDGCNVPVFGLPIAAMARSFAVLAAATPEGDARDRALARIRAAMAAHPRLTEGAGRLSTELMEATAGRLVAKGGAEGLLCVALPLGLGVALKCEDGNARALPPAAIALLDHLGGLDDRAHARLQPWALGVQQNHAGRDVGRLEVRFDPGQPASVPPSSGLVREAAR